MAMLRLMQSMPFWGIAMFPLTYYCVYQLSLLLPGRLILSTTYVLVLVSPPCAIVHHHHPCTGHPSELTAYPNQVAHIPVRPVT